MTRGDALEAEFAALAPPTTTGYYPGSSLPLPPKPGMPREDVNSPGIREWDKSPRVMAMPNGTTAEFFDIAALAAALGRKSGTIRKWETTGIIPKALYLTGSDDPRGVRRLYSRAQIVGLVRIAAEEKVLVNPDNRPISKTQFSARAHQLWESLKGQQP